MDPTTLLAILGALVPPASVAVAAVKRRAARRALVRKRVRFVEGLPTFGRSPAQLRLADETKRLRAAFESLETLRKAKFHLLLPEVPDPDAPNSLVAHGCERALLAAAESALRDGNAAIALAYGESEMLRLLRDAPETFAELSRDAASVFARMPRLKEAARLLENNAPLDALRVVVDRGPTAAVLLKRRARNVAGGAVSALAGAKLGALIGSAIAPGVGSVVGAAAGGLAATVGLAHAGEKHDAERAMARRAAVKAFDELLPLSAAEALRKVRSATFESRKAFEEVRSRVAEPADSADQTGAHRERVTGLLRLLLWRLDEGSALLESEGNDLLRTAPSLLLGRAQKSEEALAQQALASRKRSHARATEALKSALKEPDPSRAISWVVDLPLPSHPELDEWFDNTATEIAAHLAVLKGEAESLRTDLARAWTRAVRAHHDALQVELWRHHGVRLGVERALLEATDEP